MKSDDKLLRLLAEADAAKNRLVQVAEKLNEAGYGRKAESCMTLVYRIEEWQSRG